MTIGGRAPWGFRPIFDYDESYFVSRHGEVYSALTSRILKPASKGPGYLSVCLRKAGRTACRSVHSLVAQAFVANPHNKRTVNHKNGIVTDNRRVNLEWSTHSENHKHAYRTLGRVNARGHTKEVRIHFGTHTVRFSSMVLAARVLGTSPVNVSHAAARGGISAGRKCERV